MTPPASPAPVTLPGSSAAGGGRFLVNVVDGALTALLTRPLTTVTYLTALDRDDAGDRLSTALGRPIVQRSSDRERIFVDVTTRSAVRIVMAPGLRDDEGTPQALMAESITPGTEPDLYQRLADAAVTPLPVSHRPCPGAAM
ncbi:hypothetical protein BS329_15850 [Amycolatopsis coloradensis]|uniref:Uncharacterized protein n=1 Tax=Amycolatopsis coloradensis TaxID=76021 RepID=A0A1R0KUF1_9PSEU|nr:hypothetical protein [Amycolatopsis coloradensis]OLZ51734.1 hypothetical protein BS329_15850 [Amycolatopsis coloradensis]